MRHGPLSPEVHPRAGGVRGVIHGADPEVIAVTATDAVPTLVTVTARGALAVPTFWLVIVTAPGIDSWPPGGGVLVTPVPESEMERAPPPP